MADSSATVFEAPLAAQGRRSQADGAKAVASPRVRLFQISFLILFFELACIRWFGSTVVFLTFFTNIVLIACFLGMSVGCLAARRTTNFINFVLPLTAVASVLAGILLVLHQTRPDLVFIDVGNQKSPATIYFGAEYGNPDIARAIIPIEVIGGTFFLLIAMIFVGLGQEMGRAFNAIPDRLSAYTTDILGSLAGIAVFALMSYAWIPPLVWFAISCILLAYLIPKWEREQTIATIAILCLAGAMSLDGIGKTVLWSPYYKITYDAQTRTINTNNIGHQQMHDLTANNFGYTFIHRLNADAGNATFDDVMIIGAGSGNDVTAALMNGAKRLDAIEIDPVINEIGKALHPNRPYSDPRFNLRETQPGGSEDIRKTIYREDGRQWLKRNLEGMRQNKAPYHPYDLAIYALVDSLVLQSSHSGSLRLESFLFTQDALEDVRANLKPGGVFAMYNYYRQPWVIGRLKEMATTVFGVEPLIFSMPAQERITDGDGLGSHITFLFVGVPDEGKTSNARLDAIRAKLQETKSYYLADTPVVASRVNGFSATEPAIPEGLALPDPRPATATRPASETRPAPDARFFRFVPATVDVRNAGPVPTDDWPQLYLKEKTISPEVWKSMLIMGGLSALILFAFRPRGQGFAPNGRMFFLGAGFMLLETKSVVHMSLLFGGTWVTNSVVFFSILVMVLLANLFVMLAKPRTLWPYYVALVAALVVNAIVPMSWFLTLQGIEQTIVSCAVVFVPIFFAGIIFATSFSRSTSPDTDFGWNVAGVILGGLAENFSMMLGFNALVFVAIGFYMLSIATARRGAGRLAAA